MAWSSLSDGLCVTQPTAKINTKKHLQKIKGLTGNNKPLALSFLQPPLDSWGTGHCHLYAGSTTHIFARVNTWTLACHNNLVIALHKFAEGRILNNADIRASSSRIAQLHTRKVQIAYQHIFLSVSVTATAMQN